jgi:hypothetical protein
MGWLLPRTVTVAVPVVVILATGGIHTGAALLGAWFVAPFLALPVMALLVAEVWVYRKVIGKSDGWEPSMGVIVVAGVPAWICFYLDEAEGMLMGYPPGHVNLTLPDPAWGSCLSSWRWSGSWP